MIADTANVEKTDGIGAHFLPIRVEENLRVGSYTVGRRIVLTMRFHLLPQKSCSEVDRYGSLNCGSSSSPEKDRTMAAPMARMISRRKYMCIEHATATKSGREVCAVKGPLSKANSNSLKVPSQATKKAVTPPRCGEESLRGRKRKRDTTGKTTNVDKTDGIGAHFLPIRVEENRRVGSYTVGRRILVTMRFHLLPQKSCSEVDRYGLLNCGSSSSLERDRAMVALKAKMISRWKYMCIE
ncbi:hypothetical protein QQP08_001155 [Theobroma cacao]|nr:hypothetical protein QQP08_001155 [Theobroma cacao]